MPRHTKTTLAIAFVLAISTASTTWAATVRSTPEGAVTLEAGDGDSALTIAPGVHQVTLTLEDEPIEPAIADPHCARSGLNSVTCATPSPYNSVNGITVVTARMGGGDDIVTDEPSGAFETELQLVVEGEDGSDRAIAQTRLSAVLHGGAGADVLIAERTSSSAAHGGDGDDTIRATRASGGAGDDDLTAAQSSWQAHARLDGGAGADDFHGSTATDETVVYTHRTGALRVSVDGIANDGEAGENDDVGAGIDRLVGGRGDDVIVGSGAAEDLDGGDGNDELTGGPGNDRLSGRRGSDELLGGEGDDVLFAEDAGEDDATSMNVLDGGPGADRMYGGSLSYDVVTYADRSAPVSVTVEAETAGDDGETGEGDTINGFRGNLIDEVIGGAEDDLLVASTGGDRLRGGAGDDRLEGGRGDDGLEGGVGVDVLVAGAGSDHIVARDRAREAVTCGSEDDTVVADRQDDVADDCESIDWPRP